MHWKIFDSTTPKQCGTGRRVRGQGQGAGRAGAGVGYRDGEGFRAGDVVQSQDEEFAPMQGTEPGTLQGARSLTNLKNAEVVSRH